MQLHVLRGLEQETRCHYHLAPQWTDCCAVVACVSSVCWCMAVMLQEWKCEVIWNFWVDNLRISMNTCSSERGFIDSRSGVCAVAPKCLRLVVKMLLFWIDFKIKCKNVQRNLNFVLMTTAPTFCIACTVCIFIRLWKHKCFIWTTGSKRVSNRPS